MSCDRRDPDQPFFMKIQFLRFPITSRWRLGLWNDAAPTDRFQAKAGPGHDPGRSPVRTKKTRQIKDLQPRFDSIETERAPAHFFVVLKLFKSLSVSVCPALQRAAVKRR
jgi:hypothetical protein